MVVDYVIKILFFTNSRYTNWTIFVDIVHIFYISTSPFNSKEGGGGEGQGSNLDHVMWGGGWVLITGGGHDNG